MKRVLRQRFPGMMRTAVFVVSSIAAILFADIVFLSASPATSETIEGVQYDFVGDAGQDEVADTVILKSGKVYTNVKTFPRGGTHTVKFQNGRSIAVPNSKIKIVRIKGVSWKARVKRREVAVASVAKKRQPRRVSAPQPRRPRRVVVPRNPIGREMQAMQGDQKPEVAQPTEEKFALGPVTKSILLPGWGQHSIGFNWRAASTVALALPIVQGYDIHLREFNSAQERYSDQLTPLVLAQPQFSPWGFPAYYSLLTFRREVLLNKEDQTNTMVFALMGLWALQALDTYYLNYQSGGQDPFFKFASKIGFTDRGSSPTTLIAFSDGKNFIFGMGVRF